MLDAGASIAPVLLEEDISGRIKNEINVIKVLSTARWINHTLQVVDYM